MPTRIPVAERFGSLTCHGGCDMQSLKPSEYARKIFQFLHVSVHEVPGGRGSFIRQVRLLVLTSFLFLWLFCYPAPVQLRSILAASGYTFIEYIFTYFSDGKSFTSFAQFWGNLVYTPILLDLYWNAIIGETYDLSVFGTTAGLMYVVLFPFNIWLLEIVLDQWFMLVYGRNVAWCYCTYSDSYVGGALRLGHAVYWILMGIGCLVVYPYIRQSTDKFQWSSLW